MEPQDFQKLNEGKQASYMLDGLTPILDNQVVEIIARFKGLYRSDQLDLPKSLAIAAELCTLEDIQNKLKQKISIAKTVANKEY